MTRSWAANGSVASAAREGADAVAMAAQHTRIPGWCRPGQDQARAGAVQPHCRAAPDRSGSRCGRPRSALERGVHDRDAPAGRPASRPALGQRRIQHPCPGRKYTRCLACVFPGAPCRLLARLPVDRRRAACRPSFGASFGRRPGVPSEIPSAYRRRSWRPHRRRYRETPQLAGMTEFPTSLEIPPEIPSGIPSEIRPDARDSTYPHPISAPKRCPASPSYHHRCRRRQNRHWHTECT